MHPVQDERRHPGFTRMSLNPIRSWEDDYPVSSGSLGFRAEGPSYTSPARRAGFGMDTNQSAVGAIYRLLEHRPGHQPEGSNWPGTQPGGLGWYKAGLRP